MSRCRQRKKAASTTDSRPKPISMRRRQRRLQRALDQHLAAHDGVHRHVEQQAGQHGGDRRRAFRVRVRQPVVQRREADLGAVAHQQEHERQARAPRARAAPFTASRCVHSSALTPSRAEHLLGREVQQDRAEQRLRDADAAENEVLPAGLEARGRAVQRHQQHGRQRRRLHRDPQQPHVVGRQRHQHRRR